MSNNAMNGGGAAEGQRFRVITYNVLDGFTEANDRRDAVARWLAAQQPDVVALDELNGYTEPRLRDEAAAWGHPHAVLLKETGYATGLTSRTPITDVRRVVPGFHHGVIRCRAAGIIFYVVHLSPHDRSVRQTEADRITRGVASADASDDGDLVGVMDTMTAGEPVIVLGDFNSFSPDDKAYYATTRLGETARKGDRERGLRNLGDDSGIDFSVMQTFQDAGLVDVVRRLNAAGDPAALVSCPTPLWRPEMPLAELRLVQKRIDYMWSRRSWPTGARPRESSTTRRWTRCRTITRWWRTSSGSSAHVEPLQAGCQRCAQCHGDP